MRMAESGQPPYPPVTIPKTLVIGYLYDLLGIAPNDH